MVDGRERDDGDDGAGDSEHVRELRALGFPEAAIREADAARRAGLFLIEPTEEMIRSTQERCAVVIREHLARIGRPVGGAGDGEA